MHGLSIMQRQCVHLELNVDGGAELLITNGSNADTRRAAYQKD